MDVLATVIGYGVLLFGAFWLLNTILSVNDSAKQEVRSVAYKRNEMALRQLYWGGISEKEKECIKAFAMGYGFTGWHSIVITDDEYLLQAEKMNHLRIYAAAKALLETDGNPYKLENCKVVPTRGAMHSLP